MTAPVRNIFAQIPETLAQEHFLTLCENRTVTIERIVSRSHSSPPGFWYDQNDDEWVIVLRGDAVLEFEGGELIQMNAGDHLLIPGHVRHRVNKTGPDTVWLAVRMKT